MNKIMLYLMLLWTIFCPVATLFSSSLSQDNLKPVKEESILADINYHLQNGTSHHNFFFSDISSVEDVCEIDFLSVLDKFTLTPNYFFVAVYGWLIVQFFSFFKRRLPLCSYLARPAQESYLSNRVLLI